MIAVVDCIAQTLRHEMRGTARRGGWPCCGGAIRLRGWTSTAPRSGPADREAVQALRDAFVVIVAAVSRVDTLRLVVAVNKLVRRAWVTRCGWLSASASLAFLSMECTRVV